METLSHTKSKNLFKTAGNGERQSTFNGIGRQPIVGNQREIEEGMIDLSLELQTDLTTKINTFKRTKDDDFFLCFDNFLVQ